MASLRASLCATQTNLNQIGMNSAPPCPWVQQHKRPIQRRLDQLDEWISAQWTGNKSNPEIAIFPRERQRSRGAYLSSSGLIFSLILRNLIVPVFGTVFVNHKRPSVEISFAQGLWGINLGKRPGRITTLGMSCCSFYRDQLPRDKTSLIPTDTWPDSCIRSGPLYDRYFNRGTGMVLSLVGKKY